MVNIVKGANVKKLSILVILLISVTCLTFAFMPASAVSHAETDGTYQPGTYRVKNNVSLDVYIRLPNGNEVRLFEIPSTYYFDVTEIDGDVFYIKYNGIDDLYVKDASNFVSLTEADKEPLGGFTIELSLSSDASFFVKVALYRKNYYPGGSPCNHVHRQRRIRRHFLHLRQMRRGIRIYPHKLS